MSVEVPDPVIIGYIRANRGQFGREAIDDELRASGHSPEAIAAAWAAIEAEDIPSLPPDAPPPTPEPIPADADQSAPPLEPAPQPASPDPAIASYIRANRGNFSREEIERELLASGHQPEDIANAWAAIEAEDPPAVPTPSEAEVAPFTPMPPVAPQPETDPLVPTMPTPPSAMRDPAIDRYIRENRGTYTRPAIIDSLLASGHSRADIDAAWAAVAAAEAPPPPSPEARADRRAVLGSWRFWLTAVLTFVSLLVLPTVLTLIAPDQPIGPGVGCALLVGYVAAGVILLALKRARDVAYGFLAGVGALFALFGLLTLLGFILLIVVFGICLVVLGQQATP